MDEVSVTGPSGEPYEYWDSWERHYRKLKIRVPGASDAVRTVIIKYRVPNGLKFWEKYEELYWNVTGDEWEMPTPTGRPRLSYYRRVSVACEQPPGPGGTAHRKTPQGLQK